MRKKIKITTINYEYSGTKIIYGYTYDKSISKYFNAKDPFFVTYNEDVSSIPKSIAVIPFLANLIPIAWFAGFDIEVDELDEDFYNSLLAIKLEFNKNFAELESLKSQIKVDKLKKNKIEGNRSAMLFSGGVDAYATYFRNINEALDLITIHGADIDINDKKQWDTLVNLNETENLLNNNSKHYIKSNLRTFYTQDVDLLLNDLGWWGSVQHGLALNCIISPLSFKYKYSKIYIASSYTDNIKIAWGSTPEIDNLIKWADLSIYHDGYKLRRQEKVKLIVDTIKEFNTNVKLRVCYSELNKDVNCSKCEKCYRTIFGIILSNDDPNKYGFSVDEKVYSAVMNMFSRGFKTKGTSYFWWEINEAIRDSDNFFIFSSEEEETKKMKSLNSLLTQKINSGIKKNAKINRLKQKLINFFPIIFKIYLKFRHKAK
jgi:hypothetical protein